MSSVLPSSNQTKKCEWCATPIRSVSGYRTRVEVRPLPRVALDIGLPLRDRGEAAHHLLRRSADVARGEDGRAGDDHVHAGCGDLFEVLERDASVDLDPGVVPLPVDPRAEPPRLREDRGD